MINQAAAKLRAQIAEEGKIVVCPGVQDGLSARVCLAEGFENLYMVRTAPDTLQSIPSSLCALRCMLTLDHQRPVRARR